MTPADVHRIAMGLPEVVAGQHFGEPAYYVGKSFLTRVRDNDENVIIPMGPEERDFWVQQEPEIFHIPEKYRSWNGVFVRLVAVDEERLTELLRSGGVRVAKPAVRKKYPKIGKATGGR
jgi:hypothetical protein